MLADHESELERICHIALDCEPSSRGALLDDACAGDTALRLEIESLLAHQAVAEQFLTSPALETVARQITRDMSIVGRQIGTYRIDEWLGAGAMGEVYRAHDERLDRDVALKVLHGPSSVDREHLDRFDREARALAALNHPHIAAIYAIEEAGGVRALVLELVEGDTLDKRLACAKDRRLPVTEALDISRQIADALEAAHSKGIVHRDLKPANVKITPNGSVKVLDFGLARVGPPRARVPKLPLIDPNATLDGMLLGTPAYMSPEQARGDVVDQRADLWALGVMLYEMTTGARPFNGQSPSAIFQALLSSEPVQMDEENFVLPAELTSIIRRLLDKNPEARYQSAAELRADLWPTRNSAGRRRSVVRAFGVISVLGLAATGAVRFTVPPGPVTLPSEYAQITDFTDSATAPALSSDGRMVAFIRDSEAFLSKGQIYLKALPSGEPVRLTNDANRKFAPAFTPDGARVAYSEVTRTGTTASWDTRTVPVSGGVSSLLLSNATGLVWLDRQRTMFSEFKGTAGHLGIVTATESKANERTIYFPAHDRGMAHFSYASPDRKSVLVVEMDRSGTFQSCRLVPFDGSSMGRLVGPAGRCRSAAWSPDGRWMYFGVEVAGASHLWRQAYPAGSPEQITFGPTEEEGVAVASDGRSLITAIGHRRSAIWIHDASGERPLSSEGFAYAPRLSHDGRRVYYLNRKSPDSPSSELRSIELATGAVTSLLPGVAVAENDISGSNYDISRDEQEVVFASMRADGSSTIWLARLDGRTPPEQIARDGEYVSFGTQDDVLFVTLGKSTSEFTRIRKDGSGRERISDLSPIHNRGGVSPDGEWAVLYSPAVRRDGLRGTVAVPIHGGSPKPICTGLCWAWWSDDGRFLYVSVYDESSPERTLVIPLQPGVLMPDLPASGLNLPANQLLIPGTRVIERGTVASGPDPSTYLFVKSDVQRNLYRVPLH